MNPKGKKILLIQVMGFHKPQVTIFVAAAIEWAQVVNYLGMKRIRCL